MATETPVGIIILEGNEHTGKTTLAKYFVDHYDAVYFHQSYRFTDKMFAYHTAVLRKAVALSDTHLVVIDRLWLSEQYYGYVYRGGTQWPHEGRFMDRVLLKHAAITIICRTDENENYKAVRECPPRRDLYPPDKSKTILMHDLYCNGPRRAEDYDLLNRDDKTWFDWKHSVFYRGKSDVLWYDYREHFGNCGTFAEVALAVLSEFRRLQWQVALDPKNTNFCGHTALGSVLLVGDKLNQKNKKLEWPFYEYNNSSLYLAECLQELNVSESKLMWTNAVSEVKPTLQEVLDELQIGEWRHAHEHGHELTASPITPGVYESFMQLPTVVALGNVAYTALALAGVPEKSIIKIPHPQWGRRFDTQKRLYLKSLGEALGVNSVLWTCDASPGSSPSSSA